MQKKFLFFIVLFKVTVYLQGCFALKRYSASVLTVKRYSASVLTVARPNDQLRQAGVVRGVRGNAPTPEKF